MMKKLLFSLILFFLVLPSAVYANNRVEVSLAQCIDGDTARFIMNHEVFSTRFLAIDTPEVNHPTIGEEPFGKEASEFTCEALTNAKIIELEFDPNSDRMDKYDRLLAWVYVDHTLLQSKIISAGLAEVKYLYGDYLYTDQLLELELKAKEQGKGMYFKDTKKTIPFWYILIIVGVVIGLLFVKKHKTTNK